MRRSSNFLKPDISTVLIFIGSSLKKTTNYKYKAQAIPKLNGCPNGFSLSGTTKLIRDGSFHMIRDAVRIARCHALCCFDSLGFRKFRKTSR